MNSKICICGIGYVGLTLAVVMAERGFSVTGVDTKLSVVDGLNHGKPHFFERGLTEILIRNLNQRLNFRTRIPEERFDAYVITVGTPLLAGSKKPNLSSLKSAAESVAQRLSEDSIVILRSTVPLGTTRNFIYPILQSHVRTARLAFCPERTVEGKALEELQTLPQIIGGIDKESTVMAHEIFCRLTPDIIPVTSPETAEMVKLMDNCFRDVTFAFANQMGMLCRASMVSAFEAIQAANFSYPRNRIPSPGFVGGACLEKDPHILLESASQLGLDPSLIRVARETNEALPAIVAARIHHLLTSYGNNPKTAKIFFTGLAFKGNPETDDLRGSSSLDLIAALSQLDMSNLFVHDFVITDEILSERALTPLSITSGFAEADAIIIGNNHPRYQKLPIRDLLSTAKHPVVFFDSWQMTDRSTFSDMNYVHYENLGLQNDLLEDYRHG